MNWVIYSKFVVLIGFSMFLGFLSAIPVGAVQVDVAKKAINGHLLPALAVAAGSVTSDFIYGTMTLFGIGHFLVLKQSQIVIYSLGILVLSFLLYRSYQEYRHVCHPEDSPLVYKKRFSFSRASASPSPTPASSSGGLSGSSSSSIYRCSPRSRHRSS